MGGPWQEPSVKVEHPKELLQADIRLRLRKFADRSYSRSQRCSTCRSHSVAEKIELSHSKLTLWKVDDQPMIVQCPEQSVQVFDVLLDVWTRNQDVRRLMCRLQSRRVHAAQVNTMRDLFSDPQIAFREVWQKQSHPELGEHKYRMVSYDLSETPGSVRGPAPCLGADNEEVFIEWLGLTRKKYEELSELGIFS